MMHFTCTYCEKPINSVTIIVDKTHFLHQGCEEAFKRKNVIQKWDDSNLLIGLKGHVKTKISDLFESCKSDKIE